MTKLCPHCNVPLHKDYWDTVEEQHNGGFIIDCFEALVCENRCGYYERVKLK